jgi:hypothetical protein
VLRGRALVQAWSLVDNECPEIYRMPFGNVSGRDDLPYLVGVVACLGQDFPSVLSEARREQAGRPPADQLIPVVAAERGRQLPPGLCWPTLAHTFGIAREWPGSGLRTASLMVACANSKWQLEHALHSARTVTPCGTRA